MTTRLLFASAVVSAVCALPAGAAEDVDYQKVADAASWDWHPERVNLLSSVMNVPKEYTVEVVRPKNTVGKLTIRFVLDDKAVYTWDGSTSPSFVVDGTVVYCPLYNTWSEGCTLVAVDLQTQKELWSTPLQGLGGILHSVYQNRVLVESVPGAILVHGNETAGKYIEYVDKKSGKTVGHRIFKE